MENIDELKQDAEKAYQLGDKELALSIYKKLDALSVPEVKPDFSSSTMGRFLTGAQSTGESVGQMVAHALPENAQIPIPSVSFGGKNLVNFDIAHVNPKDYLEFGKKLHEEQAAKNEKAGIGGESGGIDIAGIAGSMINPLAAVSKNPLVAGALMGVTQPTDNDSFVLSKLGQAGTGALLGKVGQKVGEKAGQYLPKDAEVTGARASLQADEEMAKINAMNVPESLKTELRGNLLNSLKSGVKYDSEALARQAQAEKLGIKLMRGQATRDPALYSQEVNLRGASPAIMNRLNEQDLALRQALEPYAAGAQENYNLGSALAEKLRVFDKQEQARIGQLYQAAREHQNADLMLPTQKLATDYANILDNYGDVIPAAVRKQFEDYGLLSGKQLKIFSPENADKLEKTINRHYGNDPSTNRALGELKTAIRSSIAENIPENSPFTPAVQAAAKRFKQHEDIPAIPAALEGNVRPEKFVNQFIVNDSIDNVKRLAAHLDPESMRGIKAKLGEQLNKAAFGAVDSTGDAAFNAKAYAKELRKIGNEKLELFFSPEELDKAKMLENVASYIKTAPKNSAVNYSNTMVSALQNSPAFKFVTEAVDKNPLVNLAPTLARHIQANTILKGEIPKQSFDLSQNQALVDALRRGGALAGGYAGGQSFNN